MGLHRHVRICVDGEKVRSAGGTTCKWIKDRLDKGFTDAVRDNLRYVPDDGNDHIISLTFVKRHRCNANRTIERVVRIVVRKLETSTRILEIVDEDVRHLQFSQMQSLGGPFEHDGGDIR